MKILNLFSKTYKLVRCNLILIQPLLLFFIILGFIANPFMAIETFTPVLIMLWISIISLFCVFISGWLSMVHKCIKSSEKGNSSEEETALASLSLIHEFFPGVGKYFLKITLGVIIYISLLFIVTKITTIAGKHFIGIPSIDYLQKIFEYSQHSVINKAEKIAMIEKSSPIDNAKLSLWFLLVLGVSSLFHLITMFWTQAIITLNKKPIQAYIESLKIVIKQPIASIIIFLSYSFCLFFICIIGSLFSNFFYQLLILMLLFLSVVYFTMMTFLYFEEYAKNNNSSWTNSFR